MRFPQRAFLIHHNIHLDNDSRSAMIRPYGINRKDVWGVCHGDVGDPLLHVCVSRDADEELEFGVGG